MYLPGIHVMCSSCWAPCSHLSNDEKRPVVVAAFRLWSAAVKTVIAQTSGQFVQPDDIDVWDLKKGQQFTLLRRITNYKSVNSESIEGSILSHRVPSWGSCHLVDSTWVTHLNWNNVSNFVVECIGRDNDPKTKNLTCREFSARRGSSTDAQYSCSRCSGPP